MLPDPTVSGEPEGGRIGAVKVERSWDREQEEFRRDAVARARNAVRLVFGERWDAPTEDRSEVLADLISDLLHLARHERLRPRTVVPRALFHFLAEELVQGGGDLGPKVEVGIKKLAAVGPREPRPGRKAGVN